LLSSCFSIGDTPDKAASKDLSEQLIQAVQEKDRKMANTLAEKIAEFVKDSAGQQLAYIYFEDEPGRRGEAKFGCVARGDPPRGFLSVAGRLVVV
jgi:hypothetical protein